MSYCQVQFKNSGISNLEELLLSGSKTQKDGMISIIAWVDENDAVEGIVHEYYGEVEISVLETTHGQYWYNIHTTANSIKLLKRLNRSNGLCCRTGAGSSAQVKIERVLDENS